MKTKGAQEVWQGPGLKLKKKIKKGFIEIKALLSSAFKGVTTGLVWCLQSEYTFLESGPTFFINIDYVQQISYLVLKHIVFFF
jgi:hypothetical protein